MRLGERAGLKPAKPMRDVFGDALLELCRHNPKIVDLWVDPRWQFGQFSNPDPKLRHEAIDLAKRTTDIAAHMEAEIMVYWPAQDGFDYPFQADHRKRLDDLIEGLAEWADHNPKQKVVVEYKAFEPHTHNMLPTIGHCMTVVNEINRPNLGVNIDMGHALIMKENLADSIAPCCRYDKLFHADDQELYFEAFDALDRLGEIKAPTLVLVGEQDVLTPPWEARKLAEAIPNAK